MSGNSPAIDRGAQVPFQDRETIRDEIAAKAEQPTLINIYGEAGIGKSRLLTEAAAKIAKDNRQVLLVQIDLQSLPALSAERPEALLRALAQGARGQLRGLWQNPEQVAADMVEQLGAFANQQPSVPVYLMFDATEHIQEDSEFWRWFEARLIAPLVVRGRTKLVFAGRVPAPWRRYEVRRMVDLRHLEPLERRGAAENLLDAALQLANGNLSPEERQQAIPLLYGLSFGHPGLSLALARQAAPQLPAALADATRLKKELSERVVRSLTSDYLFRGLEQPWPKVLELASVLDQFDAQLLREYLGRLDEGLVRDRPDYVFMQWMARLRDHYALVWYAGEGYAVQGVLRDILLRNLELLQPEVYKDACGAAAKVYEQIAQELAAVDAQASGKYEATAKEYRTGLRPKRLKESAQ